MATRFRSLRHLTLGAVVMTAGCTAEDAVFRYRASVRWTENGVPHVLAEDWRGLAYGQAWAFAKSNGCMLADQIVKVRSERASYLGPGEDDEHIDSDFAHLAIGVYENAESQFGELPLDIQRLIEGYAAGYNAYLEESDGELPGGCAGEDWVRPISEIDLFAHFLELATLGSARQIQNAIATAQPPNTIQLPPRQLPDFSREDYGSNGWAFGKDLTASGGGLVMVNPHFPWEGELRFFENHLTIPGVVNVYGGSLGGAVGVHVGFNENIAWTHTVSSGKRFTFYELELDPNDPTAYLFDGAYRPMETREFSIEVLQDDGSLAPLTRTLYASHYGPMVNVAPFGWDTSLGITFRDGNGNNVAMIETFLGMDQAQDMDAFQAVHAERNGIPWVNTMAASADGRAWYADSSTVPLLSEEAIALWEAAWDELVTGGFLENDAVILDGGDPRTEWAVVEGAREPGLTPFSMAPSLERTDFVFNANDSHWLSNPAAPLEGYQPLYGDERAPRSPRTRMNATLLTETGPDSIYGVDGKLSFEELQQAALGNRGFLQELLRDEVVSRCASATTVTVSGQEVNLGPICAAIDTWDGLANLDSRGAVAWREVVLDYETPALKDAGVLFEVPFDPDDPVVTPHTIVADDARLFQALGRATLRLEQAGIAPDVALGEVQFTRKGTTKIPIHGGSSLEGITNVVGYGTFKTELKPPMERNGVIHGRSGLTQEGYVINTGSSIVMSIEVTPDGPRAASFVTYSQSSDPASDNHADQTLAFSNKQWRVVRFTEDDIADDPDLVVEELKGN